MNNYDVISNGQYYIGESPIWDSHYHVLLWADVVTGCIYEYCVKSGTISIIASNVHVSGFVLNKNGLIIVGSRGIIIYDRRERLDLLSDRFDGQSLKCSDATADFMGRLLFGTSYYAEGNNDSGYLFGKLYKAECDGKISILDEGFHYANGLGFSPDSRTLYFTDTVLRIIYAYDYDPAAGTVKNRRVFVKVPDCEGIPNGLAVDAQGYIWSAQWYGGCVVRYDPDGRIERRIQLPVRQISSLAFGGVDMTDIYVTTAGKSIKLSIAPRGYDFNTDDVGGHVYRYNFGIAGKKEFAANITI